VRSCQLHAARKRTSSRSTCSPARGTRSPVHVSCVTPNSRGAAQPASFRRLQGSPLRQMQVPCSTSPRL
jgi:hypothetical protein